MANDPVLVQPVQYHSEQKPSNALADFDKFVETTVAEFENLASRLTFFRQIRADAKASKDIPLAREAHQKIQELHDERDKKWAELQPMLQAIENTTRYFPRRGL